MADLLKSKRTFQELGIVCVRIIKVSGRSGLKYAVWFRDGSILEDIVA